MQSGFIRCFNFKPRPIHFVNHLSMKTHSNNPYLQMAPANPNNAYGPYTNRPVATICEALNRCGRKVEVATRKAEVYADNIWNHFKVSPSLADAAMARIAQGTKVLAEGGYDKVFHQTFQALPGEKLLKPYVCHLHTSSGPVTGTLYTSTKRVAFCSDYPFAYYLPTGQQQWMYYRVVVELDRLRTVNPSANRMNPSEKYIQIVTRDGHEFWFMGFISYDKALKQLSEALQHSSNTSTAISVS